MPGTVRILMHTPEMDRLVAAASRLVTTDARGASLWNPRRTGTATSDWFGS